MFIHAMKIFPNIIQVSYKINGPLHIPYTDQPFETFIAAKELWRISPLYAVYGEVEEGAREK